MKKLLTALFIMASVPLFAQPWKKITGNGNVKKETRTVANFTSLDSRGSMNVEITYGNSEGIQVEADENLLPYIETTVENGKLTVKPQKDISFTTRSKITVYVSMSKINSLNQSGSGNISGSGPFTGDDKTEVRVSGSGNIKLASVAFNDLDLYVSGSGKIKIEKGTANNITAAVSGSGNIDCNNVACNDLNAKISGSGNVSADAKNSVTATISGSGNLFYNGDAKHISTKVSGSGKAIKR